MPVSKKCVICGAVFSVKAHRAATAKTCSAKCRGELQAQRYKADRPSKTCENCGVEYQVKPYRQAASRFCSPSCKRENNNVAYECLECGKTFTDYVSRQKRGAKYCSKACHAKAQRGGKDRVKLICEECGSEYEKSPCAAPISRYCNAKCSWKAKQRQVEVACDNCGKSFSVNAGRLGKVRFCSESCKWKQYTGNQSWESPDGLNREGYKRYNNTYEHRKIMLEWMLEEVPDHPFITVIDGERRLSDGIDVHHIDRDRTNNARENLLAVTRDAHARMHHRRRKPRPGECWPPNPCRY